MCCVSVCSRIQDSGITHGCVLCVFASCFVCALCACVCNYIIYTVLDDDMKKEKMSGMKMKMKIM